MLMVPWVVVYDFNNIADQTEDPTSKKSLEI